MPATTHIDTEPTQNSAAMRSPAAFGRAGDALTAAQAVQEALSAASWPSEVQTRVRIGVHTGEAQERGGDYFGPALNRAARIMSAGHGGQVLVAFGRRDLDTMISMMAEDVRDEMANVPVLTARDAVRDLYISVFEAIGDAEIKMIDSIAQDNKTALIVSLPGSDEVGGSIFHEWSDDGLLLSYQGFSRIPVPGSED